MSLTPHSASRPPDERRRLERVRGRAVDALEGFVRAVVESSVESPASVAAEDLWREGLVLAFRLLFVSEVERRSPGRHGPGVRELAAEARRATTTGERARGSGSLEDALRSVLARFDSTHPSAVDEAPLGRSLFDPSAARRLEALRWGDRPVARLLEGLIDPDDDEPSAPEDLGRIFESVLGLEPVLTTEPSRRVRHPRVEVIVPEREARRLEESVDIRGLALGERIPPGRFTLRASLGRKSRGAYYTPSTLVRFLTGETLGPLIEARSPSGHPRPARLLEIRVLDPAMGSGYFLVEACRSLATALHDACARSLERAARSSGAGARRLRAAVADVPLVGRELVETIGVDDERAVALCRRAVATRCLWGVDRSSLAVELSRLALWLVSWVDGYPPPPLSHRLVAGDSLIAPLREDLDRWPASGADLDGDAAADLDAVLARAAPALEECERALMEVVETGRTEPSRAREIERARESAAAPISEITAAWTGAVVLEGDAATLDGAYRRVLARTAGASRAAPSKSERRIIAAGRGGVPLDLLAPARRDGTRGFDVVLGNPPWDKVLPLEREFFAEHSLEVLTVPTARERRPLYDKLREDPVIRDAWSRYEATFRTTRAVVGAAYHWQVAALEGGVRAKTAGHGDSYRYFTERGWRALREGGRLGLVLPNTFYGAQSATGLRRLLLRESTLELCLGFTNARRLFDIGRGQRFCLVVARKEGRTRAFRARFGLDDPSVLDDDAWRRGLVEIGLEALERLSGEFLGFPELHAPSDLALLDRLYAPPAITIGQVLSERGIDFYQEMNMTLDSARFVPTSKALADAGLPLDADPRREPARGRLLDAGWLVVHEKGTFHAWNDGLKRQPRYCCHRSNLERDRRGQRALAAAAHPRLAIRATIHASERDKSVLCLLPPGVVVGNSALTERDPLSRDVDDALLMLVVGNSRCVNHVARLRLGTNLNQFLLESLPSVRLTGEAAGLARWGALRLTTTHEAYAPLWETRTGKGWSPGVVPDDDEARGLRATLEALVADAFGLDTAQWEEVLDVTLAGGREGELGRRCRDALTTLRRDGIAALAAMVVPEPGDDRDILG